MKTSDLAHDLTPYITQIVEDYAKLNTAGSTSTETGGAFLPREHTIWLLDSGGAAIADYEFDTNGLTSANADASAGDIIWIPAGTITADFTCTAGVRYVGASRTATILAGAVTGASAATLENLTVARSASSGSALSAVAGPAAGTFRIMDCDATMTQGGAGDSYGLSVTVNGTTVIVWNSSFVATSGAGDGYGTFRSGTAILTIYDGYASGDTATQNE